MVSVHVAVYARQLGGIPLVESHAGSGPTREAAIGSAFLKFLLGSFHVILEALAEHTCSEEQGVWHRWTAESSEWRLCAGPVVCQSNGNHDTLSQSMESFIAELQPLFASLAPTAAHWFRVFVGSYDDEIKSCDVVLDNELWQAATDVALKWKWPTSPTYRSARVFAIGLPLRRADG